MSLKGKFKTDAALVRDGTWFDVTTNSDGSKCRVKLRRSGRGNPLWSVSFREHTKDQNSDDITPEEDEIVTAKIFAESCVAEWENMQPDDDGKNLKFSIAAAYKLLSDPDWVQLLSDWQTKSNSLTPFQSEKGKPPTKLEEEAKN